MLQKDVGQFFILGFRGTTLPSWLKKFEETFGLGGVILFDYNCQTRSYDNNIQSREQVKALCGEISALPSKPLIFIDQEGGKVRRLKEKLGFAPLPSQLRLNTLPIQERYQMLEASFRELRELGIHFNLAPVIDLNFNPLNPDIGAVERSYSASPDEVRTNVKIVDEVARKFGLGLCLKHFPGLGGARVNSHEEITDLTDSLDQGQIALFYELGKIISGQAVLVSHGIVQSWEKDLPVSISPIGVGHLRKNLPDALLISDDLQMQGLQKKFPSQQACAMGLRAGLDLLCIGNNLIAEDEKILDYAEFVYGEISRDPDFEQKALAALQRIGRTKELFC